MHVILVLSINQQTEIADMANRIFYWLTWCWCGIDVTIKILLNFFLKNLKSNLILKKILLIIINFHKNTTTCSFQSNPTTKNSNPDYKNTNLATNNSNLDYNNTNEKRKKEKQRSNTNPDPDHNNTKPTPS